MTDEKVTVWRLAKRNMLAGLMAIIPLSVTVLALSFMLGMLRSIARPPIEWTADMLEPYVPLASHLLRHGGLQTVAALILILAVLLIIGWFARRLAGKRLIRLLDRIMASIPVVEQIYGASKKFLDSIQRQPDGVQRVVLIEFPTGGMKTVGLVTRTLVDSDTGKVLAAVYVPTTPNPTSGYLEIVPVENLISTDWSVDEAMTFILTGGTISPDNMNYDKSHMPIKDFLAGSHGDPVK